MPISHSAICTFTTFHAIAFQFPHLAASKQSDGASAFVSRCPSLKERVGFTILHPVPAVPTTLAQLKKLVPDAIKFYWQTRAKQLKKQRDAGGSDQGLRSAVIVVKPLRTPQSA
jgi:hypothetical protein